MREIEKQVVEVPADEWGTADAPYVLIAGRDEQVYTCTVLGLHNLETRVGYLAYYDRANFIIAEEMVGVALQEATDPKQLVAWAGGAALYELAEPEVTESRQRVANYLQAHDIPLTATCWLDDGHQLSEVTLDCGTSQVAATIRSIYDELDD